MRYVKAELQDLLEATHQIGHRKYNLSIIIVANGSRGVVYIAVCTSDVDTIEDSTSTRRVVTAWGNDREKNMVAFADAALSFLRDIMVRLPGSESPTSEFQEV